MENGSFIGEDYFEHLLAEIREIRLSERRFYQKLTDIYATAVDYNKDAPTTKALKKSAGGDIAVFLLITYGYSQLSTIGVECFFVVGGVRAFGDETLAQVVDFVVVLLNKMGGLFV